MPGPPHSAHFHCLAAAAEAQSKGFNLQTHFSWSDHEGWDSVLEVSQRIICLKRKKSSLQLSSESAGKGNDCFHGVNSTIMQMGILGKHCLFWSSALCVQIVELLAKASGGKKCEFVQNSTSKWTYIWRHYFEKFKWLSFQITFQNQNFCLN